MCFTEYIDIQKLVIAYLMFIFKGVFCRCWKSKKFPYCDGSHTKHNEETGDNVGPLIVKKKQIKVKKKLKFKIENQFLKG